MKKTILKISSLLLSIGIMLSGSGLQSTLISIRGIEENFSEIVIGLIMSMYFIGFILGAFICPGIIQRARHIRTFCVLTATCSGAMVLMGLWINPWVWAILRFVLGICIVGMYMVVESWLNSQATNTNRGSVFSIYTLVNLVFLITGQFLILAGDVHTMELFAIAAALFSISLIPVALTRIEEPVPVTRINLNLITLFKVSSLGFVGCMAAGMLSGLFWSLGPLFARLSGLSNFGIASFMSITILGGILFLWPIGRWSDNYDRRQIILILASICALASFSVILIPEGSIISLSVCMLFLGAMMFAIYPVAVAHANDLASTEDRFSITTNLLVVHGIGAATGPLIGGLLINLAGRHGLFILFIITSLFLVCFAHYWRKHGTLISENQKIHCVPSIKTTQVAVEMELADK